MTFGVVSTNKEEGVELALLSRPTCVCVAVD